MNPSKTHWMVPSETVDTEEGNGKEKLPKYKIFTAPTSENCTLCSKFVRYPIMVSIDSFKQPLIFCHYHNLSDYNDGHHSIKMQVIKCDICGEERMCHC